ncbi:MAG TPA: hypothetical protein VH092_29685 [Urbifossiella sp.]|jgi:hypothetical protein|nr:hypothetical protein [Urbifossiella sp.]
MRRSGLAGIGLVLVASAGCSGGVKCVPVTGSLKVNDKPPEGLLVTLVPTGGNPDPTARPSGLVGADGTYTLSTYDAAARAVIKGAPPGTYKVILSWLPLRRPGDAVDPNPSGKPPADKLGGRYLSPELSTFEVTVKDEPTELALIKVSESGTRARAASPFER